MSPTIRHKYKYFLSTVQRAKDRRQKFHFCCLPFDVRPLNVKLNLSINSLVPIYTPGQREHCESTVPCPTTQHMTLARG